MQHCVLAVVRQNQNFLPHHRPIPGSVGWPKFNQLEMITNFTYRPSLQFRVIMLMNTLPTHCKHTDRTNNNTLHCATKLSMQCNNYPVL